MMEGQPEAILRLFDNITRWIMKHTSDISLYIQMFLTSVTVTLLSPRPCCSCF